MNLYTTFQSDMGRIVLQANENGLLGVWFETQTTQPDNLGDYTDTNCVLNTAVQQLQEYFAGGRKAFSVPIAAQGTQFQQQVWHALTTIPYGETWTYQELANAIGNPKAVRAVGTANGKNPLSVIVPCHRVIGKDGTLTGYAGGVERKAQLLKLEQVE